MYTVNNQQFLHVLYLHCFASNTTYVYVFVHVDIQNKINTFVMPQGYLVEALTDYPETCCAGEETWSLCLGRYMAEGKNHVCYCVVYLLIII